MFFLVRREVVASKFAVDVSIEGRPLRGANVSISTAEAPFATAFEALTGTDGTVPVTNLTAGSYSLGVSYLGVGTIHTELLVMPIVDKVAMRVTYALETASAERVRAVVGQVSELGDRLLSEILPTSAALTLSRVESDFRLATTMAKDGSFAFPPVEPGLYVLRLRSTGRQESDTSHLLRVSVEAPAGTLRLFAAGGACGQTMMWVDRAGKP